VLTGGLDASCRPPSETTDAPILHKLKRLAKLALRTYPCGIVLRAFEKPFLLMLSISCAHAA